MKQTKEQFVGISYDELLAENAKKRMTIYEALFGSPERVERTLTEASLPSFEMCWALKAISEDGDVRCRNCLYEPDGCGCTQKDMTLLEWLNSDVAE